jgi:tetratricopeptide (TPR) repeat protein
MWPLGACEPRPPDDGAAARLQTTVAARDVGLAVALAQSAPAAKPTIKLLPRAQIGHIHREVTTTSPQAQAFFDQGLTAAWGFDHEEAIAAFGQAVAIDPDCAMAHWGIAFAAGPNINVPFMDPERSKLAWDAVQKAVALAPKTAPVEQALIAALAKRYAWPEPEDRKPLDRAWADAMREVHRQHPKDPDVATWFADALMNLRPWDHWSPTGEARPETPEIVSVLEGVLADHGDHPGAAHALIHTVEASPNPGRALAAADRLRGRVPGSGHLLHMASHVDIRLGQYLQAIVANQRGIAVDLVRVQRTGNGGVYAVYRAHNYHFLAYAAMFDGQKALAVKAGHDLRERIPVEVVRTLPDFLDTFYAVPYHVAVRFGMWEDILREAEPAQDLFVTTAVWRYARGIAFAATNRVAEAEAEQAAFATAVTAVPASRAVGNNTAATVLAIAGPMLEGEIEYRKGNHDRAFEILRQAVAQDDSLRYDEPWGWMQPVRHALGALLLEQGRLQEAEAVYLEDLNRHPENGWALHGLAECLKRTDRGPESRQVLSRMEKSWARSDIKLNASCFCRRGA